jgi:ABC-type amino acid transport substrate-binding protein
VEGQHAPGKELVRQRIRSNVLTFGFVALLLWGVTFLPPDTTLAQVRSSGLLRVCTPNSYPPLVTGNRDQPGIDIEILAAVADRLGVRLVPVANSAIGRDFNPRNWRITRAHCLVIAGGIVDTPATRSFLVVTRPHLETGWAAVVPEPRSTSLQGANVGFFAGLTGLDRLGLSRWLRDQGADVSVVSTFGEAHDGLTSGRFDVIVSEALSARRIAEATDGVAHWLPLASGRIPLAFGLWKGDLTLERAVKRELVTLERDGTIDALLDAYALAPIEEECPFCR